MRHSRRHAVRRSSLVAYRIMLPACQNDLMIGGKHIQRGKNRVLT